MPNNIKFNIDPSSQKGLENVNNLVEEIYKNLQSISQLKVNPVDRSSATRERIKAEKTLNTSLKQIEAQEKRLAIANSNAGKELAKLRLETQVATKKNKELAKSTLGMVTPYDKLKKSMVEAKKNAKNIGIEFGLLSKEYKKAKKEANDLDAQVRELDYAMGDHQINVGNYQSAFENLFPAVGRIREGLEQFGIQQDNLAKNSNGATSLFANLKSGIAGATRASLAFIATPIGATITALAGIGFATKKFFDFNNVVIETNLLLESITNKTGDTVNAIRVRAESLNKVFDKDIKESTIAAQKLVVQFGVSYEKAFDIIEEGLIRGGTANSKFLESLSEYGQFFSDAGFSASEFQQIVNAGFDLGIYKDKLPDAIKEFDISLREQTQSTKDALLNAFGSGLYE